MGVTETQVRWMFAPNGVSVFPYSATDYWPGGDVVDIVGLSAYNFGQEFGEWSSVDDVLFDTTEQLKAFARDKPFMISQVGTSVQGGDREGWLAEMFDFVARDANHVRFIYTAGLFKGPPASLDAADFHVDIWARGLLAQFFEPVAAIVPAELPDDADPGLLRQLCAPGPERV